MGKFVLNRKINFITTNKNKFDFFKSFFQQGFEVCQLNQEVIEIQAKNNIAIAEYSAEWAANKFHIPVVKEDVGLYISSLKGFPGPYLSYVEKWIETEGFLKLLEDKSDRSAYWEYAIAFCIPGGNSISFSTKQEGSITFHPRGDSGYYTDKIFINKKENKTISELLDKNNYVRDTRHYKKLEEYLKAQVINY